MCRNDLLNFGRLHFFFPDSRLALDLNTDKTLKVRATCEWRDLAHDHEGPGHDVAIGSRCEALVASHTSSKVAHTDRVCMRADVAAQQAHVQSPGLCRRRGSIGTSCGT